MKYFLFFLSGFALGFGIASIIYYIKNTNKLIYVYKRAYLDAMIKFKKL